MYVDFAINKGIYQGCMLASMLVNVFSNNLSDIFQDISANVPVPNSVAISWLQFAGNSTVIARTENSQHRLQSGSESYCRSK